METAQIINLGKVRQQRAVETALVAMGSDPKIARRGVRPSHGNVRCKVRDIHAIDDQLFQVRKALSAAGDLLSALIRND